MKRLKDVILGKTLSKDLKTKTVVKNQKLKLSQLYLQSKGLLKRLETIKEQRESSTVPMLLTCL